MKNNEPNTGNQKLDDYMTKLYRGAQPKIFNQSYYYVLGFTKEGKKCFWGPIMDEEEAYTALNELQDGEKFCLATRDPHRAVNEVRSLLIKRGEQPDEALRRMLHKREGTESNQSQDTSKLFKGRVRAPERSSIMSGIKVASRVPVSISRRLAEGR